MGNAWARYKDPELVPYSTETPTFDATYGFPEGRKKREMIATEAEMISAKLDKEDRDYCAHLLIKYRTCRSDVFPFLYKCHHDRHNFLQCEYEDYVLRMKEYERERRLRLREHRIIGAH